MIRPEEYEAAIGEICFMCGATLNGRQYTFVEITVSERTDRDIQMSFYVPTNSGARDEVDFLRILGGSPINEAMDSWDMRAEYAFHNHVLPVALSPVPPENSLSADVSGCTELASVVLPKGPCVANCCWSHSLQTVYGVPKLFVPTQNENISGWRVDVIAMHGEVEAYGKRATRSLARSFRFDLASGQGQVYFAPCDSPILIGRHGPSLPFHNLWIPMVKEPPTSRQFHSICGAVLRDETAKRLVNFYEVMFVAVPVLCGCFVRNLISFPNSYVPLTVSERVSREIPVVFRDAQDGTNAVHMYIRDVAMYAIDLDTRECYSGVNWVPLAKITA